MVTTEEALLLLSYNPSTGELRWRERTPETFPYHAKRTREHTCANWNAQWAGEIAGTVDFLGRRQVRIKGRIYKAHRVIWLMVYGKFPEDQIDHINGVRDDNRLDNLREATQAQNQQNRSRRSKRGLIGTYLHESGRWCGRIRVNGVTHHLGLFDSAEEAHAAYCEKKEKLHTFQPFPRPLDADHDPRTAARHAR